MKCKVCGAESGKYPLCRICNQKKENGEIIKCDKCGKWHYINMPCPTGASLFEQSEYLYDLRKTLISKSEQAFYDVIKTSIPTGYCVFPQINLASFIDRTDDSRFHNELFRNVDFLVTDSEYKPKFIIEINDQTHLNNDRKERDEKVQKICDEAGIPILKFWTSYGVNPEYIKKRMDETLLSLPMTRIHHFSQTPVPQKTDVTGSPTTSSVDSPTVNRKNGCYIATCVYGSYDCPQVWTLRRYRDYSLSVKKWGRLFIRTYYLISPTLVKWFGKTKWFKSLWKKILDKKISKLQANGIDSTPYNDRPW